MERCNYFMRVEFPDEEIAATKVDDIRRFLVAMHLAEDDWRVSSTAFDIAPALRLQDLVQTHPTVFKALHLENIEVDEGLNQLAGKLDSPVQGEGELDIEQKDKSVCFCGEVWCFANWDGLALAMREQFGAIAVAWASDEFCRGEVFYDQLLPV